MIPPKGFKNQIYPLRHKFAYSVGLSLTTATMNSAYFTLIRADDLAGTDLDSIQVNPHSTAYVQETGPACGPMSIIDRLTITMKFNMTGLCYNLADDGDNVKQLHFSWMPVFFSFTEKLDAIDEDTAATVADILELTHDATNRDVVPLTATKLPVQGASDKSQPLSTVNMTESATTHYNMTTDATMEGVAFDNELFHNALERFTNKGALKACIGRTRHVTLNMNRPSATFRIKKFVPKSVRRIMPFTFMAILIHLPLESEEDQYYYNAATIPNEAHLGCKAIIRYHEWNASHLQDVS